MKIERPIRLAFIFTLVICTAAVAGFDLTAKAMVVFAGSIILYRISF